MRFLSILGLAVIMAGCLIFPAVSSGVMAATTFIVGPSALYYSFEAGAPSNQMKSFEIIDQGTTVGNYTIGVEKYRNFTPEEINGGLKDADPSWVKVQPDSISIPAGTKATINVLVTIPDNIPDAQYLTYIHVIKGGESEYVTVSIRTGAAVLEHKYSIEPGYYKLNATGPGDRESKDLTITVHNVGGATGRYVLTVRAPDNLDSGYGEGDPSWVQMIQPSLRLEPGQMGSVSFKLVLPPSIRDGKYSLWAVVKDEDQSSTVQIEYATKLFLDVNYVHHFPWGALWGGVGGFMGLAAVGGVAVILVRRRHRRKERKSSYIPYRPLNMRNK